MMFGAPEWTVLCATMAALAGAAVTSGVKRPEWAWRLGVIWTAGVFLAVSWATLAFYLGARDAAGSHDLSAATWGRSWCAVDDVNAPWIPIVAGIHLATVLATTRDKMRRFSVSWSLFSLAIRLAIFTVAEPTWLVGLLIVCALPPWLELGARKEARSCYALHLVPYIGLLVIGGVLAEASGPNEPTRVISAAFLMAAILIRCGTFPFHSWVVDWFERASLGNAILFTTPMVGVYAAIRLVVPMAPDGLLQGFSLFSLGTALYASLLASVQRESRRFFAYWFISSASLLLVGLELQTSTSLCGSLTFGCSAALALTGFGLSLRSVEARYGKLDLTQFHGIYSQSPLLAVGFFIMGLACVGFPGTLGFVAVELVIDGAVTSRPWIGIGLIAVSAFNSIVMLHVYFRVFTGNRLHSNVALSLTRREGWVLVSLILLMLSGGVFPQAIIQSRLRAADQLLEQHGRVNSAVEQLGRSEP